MLTLRIYKNEHSDLMYQIVNPEFEGTSAYIVEKGDFSPEYIPEILADYPDVNDMVILSHTFIMTETEIAIKHACLVANVRFADMRG